MKKILRSVLGLFIIASLITSCSSKGPSEAKYIPKDASVVFVVDPMSLQSKMMAGNIQLDSMINKIAGTDTANQKESREYFNAIKNSGVNWTEKYFLFVTQNSINDGQATTVSILGSLVDSAQLIAFIHKMDTMKSHHEMHEIKREKTYSYIQGGDNHMLAWNDKVVIVTFFNYVQKPSFGMKDTVMKAYDQSVDKGEELKKEVNGYFTQKEDASFASVKEFGAMFKEKADMYAFTTTNGAAASMSMMPFQLPKLQELMKDNYGSFTMNFADGRMVTKSAWYPNKTVAALLKKYPAGNVNTSMIESYPSQNINGLMITSFNPELIGGLLKELDVEPLVSGYMEKAGLSMQDVYKCLKGDIAFVASDLNVNGVMHPEASGKAPMYKMVFNATIGDKLSFNKLMDKAVANGYVVKENNNYRSGEMMNTLGIYLHTDDKNIIIASDSLTYQQYIAKTTKAAISSDVMNMVNGKGTATYVNLESIMNAASTMLPADTSFNAVKNTFKDMIATWDNFDGTSIKGEFQVRMKDEKTNSLVTMFNLVTNTAAGMHNKMSGWHGQDNMQIDTATVMPDHKKKK